MARVGALLLVTLLGCGGDGQTPACGEYPGPFDLRDASAREAAWRALKIPAGPPYNCTTLPAGFPDDGDAAGAGSAGDTSD